MALSLKPGPWGEESMSDHEHFHRWLHEQIQSGGLTPEDLTAAHVKEMERQFYMHQKMAMIAPPPPLPRPLPTPPVSPADQAIASVRNLLRSGIAYDVTKDEA